MNKLRNAALAAILCLVLFMAPGTAQTGEQKNIGVAVSYVNGTLDSPELLALVTVQIKNPSEENKRYFIRFDDDNNSFHQGRWLELGPGTSAALTEVRIVSKLHDDVVRVRVFPSDSEVLKDGIFEKNVSISARYQEITPAPRPTPGFEGGSLLLFLVMAIWLKRKR